VQNSRKTTKRFIPKLCDRTNIVVLADEAHRSQYGSKLNRSTSKTAATSSANRPATASKYIRDVLPTLLQLHWHVEQSDKTLRNLLGLH